MAREIDNGYSLGIMPIPRYVIPPYCGLAVSFPKDTIKEGFSAIHRLGYYASFAVALNEVTDIGDPIDRSLERGVVKQEYVVPLMQTRNLLYRELNDRLSRFVDMYPDQGEAIKVVKDDFLLLSRLRNEFDPVTALELDSGIIEAGYTVVVFNKNNTLGKVMADILGVTCRTKEELVNKYKNYLLMSKYSQISDNKEVIKFQKLHALAMAMKVYDDVEDVKGGNFDKLMGLHNLALWADDESERTGVPSSEILSNLKKYYIERSGGNVGRVLNRVVTVGSHISGRFKVMGSRSEIHPSDDVWQLHLLTRKFHDPGSTDLRHKLDQSNLLRQALS